MIQCIAKFDETERQMRLKRTLYIPDLICSLLSVSCIRRAGFRVVFEDDMERNGICLINQPGVTDIELKGIEREDGLYEVDICPQNNTHAANVALSMEEKQELWHARLGHASKKVIEKTIPIVDGIESKQSRLKNVSNVLRVNQRDTRPSVVEPQASRPLELLHSDKIGPVRNTSLGDSRYCIPLYDDFSGLSLVRFSKQKSAAAQALKDVV